MKWLSLISLVCFLGFSSCAHKGSCCKKEAENCAKDSQCSKEVACCKDGVCSNKDKGCCKDGKCDPAKACKDSADCKTCAPVKK